MSQSPAIHKAAVIPEPKGPILGKIRAKMVVAVCNAILKGRVTVINSAGSATTHSQATNNSELLIGQDGGLVIQVDAGDGGTGTSVELQTNGVDNAIQTLLNLIAGSGVTLTADGTGGVTIDSSGGGVAGIWNDQSTYSAGTIVEFPMGSIAGFWYVAPGKTAGPGVFPVWPMGDDPTWRLLNFGVQSMPVCQGGAKTMLVNASPPA